MLKDLLLSWKRQAIWEREQLRRKAINTKKLGERETAIRVWQQISKQFQKVPMADFADLKDIYVMAKYAITTDDVLVLVLLTCGTVETKEQDDEKTNY